MTTQRFVRLPRGFGVVIWFILMLVTFAMWIYSPTHESMGNRSDPWKWDFAISNDRVVRTSRLFDWYDWFDANPIHATTTTFLPSERTLGHSFVSDCVNSVGEYVTRQQGMLRLHASDGRLLAQCERSDAIPKTLLDHWLLCRIADSRQAALIDWDHLDSPIVKFPNTKDLSSLKHLGNGVLGPTEPSFYYLTPSITQSGRERSFSSAPGSFHLVFGPEGRTIEFDLPNPHSNLQRVSEGVLTFATDVPTILSIQDGSMVRELQLPSRALLGSQASKQRDPFSNSRISSIKPNDYIFLDAVEFPYPRYFNIRTQRWIPSESKVARLTDVDPVTGCVLQELANGQLEWIDVEADKVVPLAMPGRILAASFLSSGNFAVVVLDPWIDYQIRLYDAGGTLQRVIRPLALSRFAIGLMVVTAIVGWLIFKRRLSRWHSWAWLDASLLGALVIGGVMVRSHRLLMGWTPDEQLGCCLFGVIAAFEGLIAFWMVFGKSPFSIKFLMLQGVYGAGILISRDTGLSPEIIPELGFQTMALFTLAFGSFVLLRAFGFRSGRTVDEVYQRQSGQFRIVDLLIMTTAIAIFFFLVKQSSFPIQGAIDEIVTHRVGLCLLLVVTAASVGAMVRWPLLLRLGMVLVAMAGAVQFQVAVGRNIGGHWHTLPSSMVMMTTTGITLWLMLLSYRARGWELRYERPWSYRKST